MGLSKSVWGDVQSSGLRRKLRYCNKTLCECLQEFLEDGMNDPHSGLPNRFDRMLSGDAVASGVESHARQIEAQQRGMREANRLYDDNGCPPGGKPARLGEYINKAPPTVADWEALHGRPMPQYSTLQKVGWGVVGVGGVIVTGALLLSPFDGPFGEAAAGTGTAMAWSRALGLAF